MTATNTLSAVLPEATLLDSTAASARDDRPSLHLVEDASSPETPDSVGEWDNDGEFPISGDGRPTVDVTKPLNKIVDHAVRLLADDDLIFQQNSELIRVVTEKNGRVRPRPLKGSYARYLLAKGAN